MEFGILGPLEVRDGSGLVRVAGVKERALLVHAGRVVAADRLVEDLWGDDPPGKPANALQGRVSALPWPAGWPAPASPPTPSRPPWPPAASSAPTRPCGSPSADPVRVACAWFVAVSRC
jgi:hypothetical protein